MNVLVTGGCGFIGSAVVRQLVRAGHRVLNIDKMTYAANADALEDAAVSPLYTHVNACITDRAALDAAFVSAAPDAVIHLAAETHVDRSIDGPAAFIQTNITGTFTLLEAALDWWTRANKPDAFRFVHVSTDEVFGDLSPSDPPFDAASAYMPSSPYSASKAASDHLARAWMRTYGLPVVVTNCSNNYGPWQHSEKLIPTVVRKALGGERIPVYGDGKQVRDWLYVEDHAEGLIAATGAPAGATLMFGGSAERTNLKIVREICARLGQLEPRRTPYADQIVSVSDRPGHDRRYAVDASSAKDLIGWTPNETFDSGLGKTVIWYVDRWDSAAAQTDDRLGLART